MTARKQTHLEFSQRVTRISGAAGPGSCARRPHRPVVNALAGAGVAVPPCLAAGASLAPHTDSWTLWFPAALRDDAMTLLAAAIGASLALLLAHGLRVVMRRGTAARDSAAALVGAGAVVTALLIFATLPDAALAEHVDKSLNALRSAVTQIADRSQT